ARAPAGDRRVVGRYRGDPRASGVGHDVAGPARRVDRRGGVRAAQERGARRVRSDHRTGSRRRRARRVVAQGALRRGGNRPEPYGSGELGWKWSVASERHGVPIGWVIDGANRNDVRMLEPTLNAITTLGLLVDIDTLHLD